eukprot:TRINITY_DN4392_c0_g1_i7.p1 TRINITY_DN4392_c0_g1~~TRINITY_DN4392_c0_g1_i7.p1  ORF type:complete len:499 (-),score=91.10 TRINITY_DN4392_c0_g1_i7:907-2403(-)
MSTLVSHEQSGIKSSRVVNDDDDDDGDEYAQNGEMRTSTTDLRSILSSLNTTSSSESEENENTSGLNNKRLGRIQGNALKSNRGTGNGAGVEKSTLLQSPNVRGKKVIHAGGGGRKVMKGQWKKASDVAFEKKPVNSSKKRLVPLRGTNLAKASPNVTTDKPNNANTNASLKKTVVGKSMENQAEDVGTTPSRRRRGVSFVDQVSPMRGHSLLEKTQSTQESKTTEGVKGVLRRTQSGDEYGNTSPENITTDGRISLTSTVSTDDDVLDSPIGRARSRTTFASTMSEENKYTKNTNFTGNSNGANQPKGFSNHTRRLSGLHKMQRGDEITALELGRSDLSGSSSRAGRRIPSGNFSALMTPELRHKELFRASSVRRRSIVTTKNAMFRTPTPNSSRKASLSLRAGVLLSKGEPGLGIMNSDVELYQEMYGARQSEFAESVRVADNPFHYLPNASRESVQRAVDENSKEMNEDDFSFNGFEDWHASMISRVWREQQQKK